MDMVTEINEQNQVIIIIGENWVKYIFTKNIKELLNSEIISI